MSEPQLGTCDTTMELCVGEHDGSQPHPRYNTCGNWTPVPDQNWIESAAEECFGLVAEDGRAGEICIANFAEIIRKHLPREKA